MIVVDTLVLVPVAVAVDTVALIVSCYNSCLTDEGGRILEDHRIAIYRQQETFGTSW